MRSIATLRAVAMIQAPGFAGVPSLRPALGRLDEGVLHRVLGEIEIAEDAAEDRDAAGTLVAVRTGELVYEAVPEWSTMGRISILPSRASGILAAHSMASSSDSASIR